MLIKKYSSPLGEITIAERDSYLIGLWFKNQKHFASTLTTDCKEGSSPILEQTEEWLDIYFSGKQPSFTPPLQILTTPFAEKVINILRTIPYGHTITYKQIATIISKADNKQPSAQAVGGSVGKNPISIIIPCHRVVGTNGSLTGYAGGLNRKRKLLELEGIKIENDKILK
jgi:methylated-DNA-[protein]-cysteine S-methyltransferase